MRQILYTAETARVDALDYTEPEYDLTCRPPITHTRGYVLFTVDKHKTSKSHGPQTLTFGAPIRQLCAALLRFRDTEKKDIENEKFFGTNRCKDLKDIAYKFGGEDVPKDMASRFNVTYFRSYTATVASTKGLSKEDQEALAAADTHSLATANLYYNRDAGVEKAKRGNAILMKLWGDEIETMMQDESSEVSF